MPTSPPAAFHAESTSAFLGLAAAAEARLVVTGTTLEIPRPGTRGRWATGGMGYSPSFRKRAINFRVPLAQVAAAWRVTDPAERRGLDGRPQHTSLRVAGVLVSSRGRRLTVVDGVTDGPLWLEEELGWSWCTDPERAIALRLVNVARSDHAMPALPEFIRACTVYVSLADPDGCIEALGRAGVSVASESPSPVPSRLDAPPPYACWRGIRFPPLLVGAPPTWALRGEPPPPETWLDPAIPPFIRAASEGGVLVPKVLDLAADAGRLAVATVAAADGRAPRPARALALALGIQGLVVAALLVIPLLFATGMGLMAGSALRKDQWLFLAAPALVVGIIFCLAELALLVVHGGLAVAAWRHGGRFARAGSLALLVLGFLPTAGLTTVPLAAHVLLADDPPAPGDPPPPRARSATWAARVAVAVALVLWTWGGLRTALADEPIRNFDAVMVIGRLTLGPVQALGFARIARRLAEAGPARDGRAAWPAVALIALSLCLLGWPHPLAVLASGAGLVACVVVSWASALQGGRSSVPVAERSPP